MMWTIINKEELPISMTVRTYFHSTYYYFILFFFYKKIK